MEMKVIARIETDFPEKFGIPRQSGLVSELKGRIIFEPEYRNPDAVRGLDGYDYIWLLWGFDGTQRENWSATVKPPRLGGNRHMGVFATRSPFRPNPVGLSSVRLEGIDYEEEGPVLRVAGADLKNGTRIYDIKPYLTYADSHPDAREGFAHDVQANLRVEYPQEFDGILPEEKKQALLGVLAQDPRPAYHDDPQRVYGISFAGYNVRFRVEDEVLLVREMQPLSRRLKEEKTKNENGKNEKNEKNKKSC